MQVILSVSIFYLASAGQLLAYKKRTCHRMYQWLENSSLSDASFVQMAEAARAFNQAFTNQDERDKVWIALAKLEKGMTAYQQLAVLWESLSTRQSPALLCSN